MFLSYRARITDRIRLLLEEFTIDGDLSHNLDNRMITMIGYRGHGDIGFGEGITTGLLEFSELCDVLLVEETPQ